MKPNMKYFKGDIVHLIKELEVKRPDFNFAVIHQCNCFHVQKAGIAKALSDAFPGVGEADRTTPFGDMGKLGTYSSCKVTNNCTVYNLYSQHKFSRTKNNTDYDAMYTGIKSIVESNKDTIFIVPLYIGAGLAGGNHDIILNGILLPLFKDKEVIFISI